MSPMNRWLAVLISVLQASGAAMAQGTSLPYRSERLVVDGEVRDWRDGGARFVVERPPSEGEPAARAEVHVAWDSRALWVRFAVVDPTLHPPPPGVEGPALFQWDSVEIYVDGLGDRARRMNQDDFQILLAPDGRYAVLQGDPLLLELEELSVPKRERGAIAIAAAGATTADGYRVECAIPFAALGIEPAKGSRLALDLGLNDWLADHPLARQLAYDLETLRKLEGAPAGERAFTEHGLESETAEELERRLYRPWSLAGTGDFGHPEEWLAVELAGGPSAAARFVEALGPGRTLAGGAFATVLLVGAFGVVAEWRHRRRIAALLNRLAALEASSPQETPADEETDASVREVAPPSRGAAPPDPLDWLERSLDRPGGSGIRDSLERRAVAAVRARMGEPVTPTALAHEVHVSLRTLQRHLTATLGCSPGELILAVKMRAARRLLERGDLQVQEVAHRLGYDDPAHFSRRFKVYHGVAPATAIAEGDAERERRVGIA